MKFILGLLIGGGLVFGWYYRNEASDAAEKAKVRADYAAQLKAAEDQVESLNTELLKTRADLTNLATAHAKLTNIVETVYMSPRLQPPVTNPVIVVEPAASAPLPVSVPPKVAQPAPQQPKQIAPVKSGLGGPRPSSSAKKNVAAPPPAGGGLMYNDGQGRSYRIVNGKRIYY